MCGNVNQIDSVTTMFGVLNCMFEEHEEDASMLVNLYAQECKAHGAEDGCILSSLLNAAIYLTLNLLGEEGQEKTKAASMWWAGQCQT